MQTAILDALVILDRSRKDIFSRKRLKPSELNLVIFIDGIKAGLKDLKRIRSVYTPEEAKVIGKMATWRITHALKDARKLYASLGKTDKKTFRTVAKLLKACLA